MSEEITKEVVEMEEARPVAALADPRTVMLVGDVDGLVSRYDTIKQAAERVLKEGVDYGVIPGCEKPSLLKPGAEKLATLFHLHPSFTLLDKQEDWDRPLFFYRYSCDLHAVDGSFAGQGNGSCNSWEERYRYRQAKPACPECGQETIFRSKHPPKDDKNAPPGWFCWAKRGGCGANFAHDAPAVTRQPVGRILNPEPFNLVNTVDKMAQKRAFVAAVLNTTGASEFYTQDLEDLDPQAQEAADKSGAQVPTRPLGPAMLWEMLQQKAAAIAQRRGDGPASQPQASLVAQLWDMAFAPARDSRDRYHDSLIGVFDVDSATKLTSGEASACIEWLKGWTGDIPDTGLVLHEHAAGEAAALYAWLMKREGQQELPDVDEA